ncbi:hypothetical protein [Prosthecobacter dejongeii]|uniref:Large polyvalent protein associated domain-containing protein n=1 Tax=Prosthecobacter dejongeii TaxID=48465 RepID=A0A7W7YQP4_9BACT|nr:hypothetical protein [Prosthecobacter dejongeii]MBB5040586.1 hypothetical protein [Prosthecobacter dejongeii]
MPSSLLLEQDAITIRDEYDLLTEEEKPSAAAWLRDYTAQQEKSGQPLFPLEQAAQRERSQQIEKLYKNLEAVPSPISVGEPAEANRARALYANVQLLQTLYPDYKPEQHDFYKADYALRQFGSAEMDEHRFYTQVQGQFEKQERTDQAMKAANNAAFRSAAQNQNLLKAFGEWQTATPDAPDEAKQTFFNTFNATEKKLAPHRELMVGVMDAMERTMTGKAVDSDDAFLQGAKELLLDVPDGDLPLVLATMRLDAEKRGLIQSEKKGTGYKHGAWQMLKGLQLVAPFGTVVENPEGELFWQQMGESIFRFGRGALKDRERMEKRIENVTEKGQIKFSGDAIRTVEDARKYVDEFMMEEFTSESMSSMDNPGGALVMRSLLDKRKTITLDAAATQLIQEAKARQMKGVRIEFEMDNLGDIADPVPNVFASTLGTSGTALALTVATRGMALPLLAVGYKNLEYSELSLKYPGMSREDKSQIAWLSGGLQALGDGIGGGALTKLPALKKLITQPLTNALIARAVGRVGLTYGVENLVEGGQDIATPALMLALKSDVPGYDWDHELKNFWAGRADVAMGMIPLTLLGVGGSTLRDIHGVQEMLSQNELLARAGTIEADRMIIVDLAQKGDVNGARVALQEAWARRDPAVAAEYQATMTEQQGRAQKAFEEATHLGLLPTVRKKDETYIVTDAAGNQAQFTSAQEAWQAAAESMTPEQHRLVNDLLQQRAGNGVTSENRLQFSQSEGTQGQPAAQPPRTPGQAMQALAENENRFRRGPASESKELVGIVQEYELAQEVDFVDETFSIQDPHASKVEQIHLKNGGNAYLFHAKDGTVWMDRTEMRVSENDPVQGGDLVTQAFMTYAHNNGLRVRPDPLSVSDIAQQRDLSHMLSSALRHRTTGHLMPNGINLKTGEAFENMPGWREGDSREAFDHNVDLLARAEYEAVRSAMQTHGQTRLEDLRWDPQDDTVINVVTGRRLSERDFKSIVSGLDSGNSGVGATTLSRALVARQALQSNGSGKPDLERTESADIQSSGGTVDESGDKLFTLLQNKKLFYSQPDGSGATLGTTLGSSEQLGQTLAETARFLNQKQPGLVNEHTHLFTTVEALLASDYARQYPFTESQIADIQGAEGFYDRRTGASIILASNIQLQAGESDQAAVTRVILHERVGEGGIHRLLGVNPAQAQRFQVLAQRIPEGELSAILEEEGYAHLRDHPQDLAIEWFARRAQARPDLLQKRGLLQDLWHLLRETVADWQTRLGLSSNRGRSFDAQVESLIQRARDQAIKGRPLAAGESGQDADGFEKPRLAFSLPIRQDKPTSWAAVKPGHRWMSAKGFIPKLSDKRPIFDAMKRGSFQEKVSHIANWLSSMPKVKDPWGGTITLANPQGPGGFPTKLENRAAHMLGEKRDKKVEKRTEDPVKVQWIGAVQQTIEQAQVRVRQGHETLYFRSYAEGVHMVVVEEGIVKDQFGVVSQYRPNMARHNFDGAVVEKVR